MRKKRISWNGKTLPYFAIEPIPQIHIDLNVTLKAVEHCTPAEARQKICNDPKLTQALENICAELIRSMKDDNSNSNE